MINAYLTSFPMLYEGEDIEVRFGIVQDNLPVNLETIDIEYTKPATVGIYSVLTLLRKLMKYKEDEIIIFINDAALSEIINGTNKTKNGDVLKAASKLKKELVKFEHLHFVNVTKDKVALAKWKEILDIK